MAVRKLSKAAPCVLIVEADPLVRMAAAAIVEHAGCTPLRAASTDDAIDLLKTRRDIWMVFADADAAGTVDGLTLAHAVRRRWPPIHLLLVSSNRVLAEADLPERAWFFRKPFEANSIASTLGELLEENAQPVQSDNGGSAWCLPRGPKSDQSSSAS